MGICSVVQFAVMAAEDNQHVEPREKTRQFPATPGVYLMKDAKGRVIYVGKALNLRSRASSYFHAGAKLERRLITDMLPQVWDIDYVECDSEVDALLTEARLIKDLQPPFNERLKDDKTFPYLEIFAREDFPRVEFTRTPSDRGTKLYGPFTSAKSLRGAIQVLQKIFKFRTCSLEINEGEEDKWRWFRPCLLHNINQCTAPCNLRITKDDYRKDIHRLRMFLEGKKKDLFKELESEMQEAAASLDFEKAGSIRDEIESLKSLNRRGKLDQHFQPEVFYIDPKKGLAGLEKLLKLDKTPRTIDGIDIAHLAGTDSVGSLVQFIDGVPFKPGYRRFRIRSVDGNDDFASIREVVTRRFRGLRDRDEVFPDILLIDGGKGQLSAAIEAFTTLGIEPPVTLSLAKEEEEIFRPGRSDSMRLSRHAYALRLLQYVRDEAHRFAQHYHHILRRKRTLDED